MQMTEEQMAEIKLKEVALKRPFSPDRIKWRAANFRGSKSHALLYIDARDVMDRLDEVVGPTGWTTDYANQEEKSCQCTLGVRYLDRDSDWTYKADVGTPSTFEGVKGMYSDALKRAAVQHGIARYLYDDDILRGTFELKGEKFSDEANENISKLVHQHYNFYGNQVAEVLKNLFNSAGTMKMLIAYHKSNRDHIEHLKENDAASAQQVSKIFKKKQALLKIMEENNNG